MQTTTETPTTKTPNISTYHRDGIAVNVKDNHYWAGDTVAGPLIDELDESTVEACYEATRETFWEDARELAQEYGYDDVFAMGRSGGWLGVMRGGRAVDIDYDRWANGEYGPCDEWDSYERDEWWTFATFANALMPYLDAAGEDFRFRLGEAMADLEQRHEDAIVRGDS